LTLILTPEPGGFAALYPAWNDLLRSSRFDTVFLTWEWQQCWWKNLGAPRGPLHLLSARDGDARHGIVPLYAAEEDGSRILHVVGCTEVSDYLDLVMRAGDGSEEAVYGAFLDWLAGPDAPEWDTVDLCNQPGPSLSHTLLPAMARARGFDAETVQEDVCPIIALPKPTAEQPDPWEAYLASLDKKERHEIRRKQRRFEREAPGGGVRFTGGGPDLDRDIETFIALHRKSHPAKHAFMTAEMQDFFRAIARVLAEAGWLQLSFLEVDGQAVAAYFCMDYGGSILVYNSGYDPGAVPQLSPGWVLLSDVIRHAIELGRETFDFLQGDEDYKHRFGGVDTPVYRTLIRRG
jgi:CelD/BcsL family acetyltransferase involved in cellulose biosynthesis